MAGYFENKVIWLTGASSGIGEALAYELSARGARLILSARRKDELERVKGNCIPDAHPNIRLLPLDLLQGDTLLVSSGVAIQFFGHVDILINNAGIGQNGLAREASLDVDRQIMEVDYFGTVALTKHMIPHFLSRKSGHIVVVSSVMGKIGAPRRSAYAAAKHALHGFFDSLRAELWQECRAIRVTIVCPGWVQTNLRQRALTNSADSNDAPAPIARGMRPDLFADKMLRAIRRKKEEVYIGGSKELNAVRAQRFFPRLYSRIIRRTKLR